MKHFIIFLLLLCSIAVIGTSCESRCRSGREKALSMPKDKELVGIWRQLDVYPGQEAGEYMILEANGTRQEGLNPNRINITSIWYTVEKYLYTYDCIQYNPYTDKDKYDIKNDTLTLSYDYSEYGEPEEKREIVYIRVKEY